VDRDTPFFIVVGDAEIVAWPLATNERRGVFHLF
jgi:hypothetical protein